MSGSWRVLMLVTEAFGGRGGIAAVTRDVAAALGANDEVESVEIHPLSVTDPAAPPSPKLRQLPAPSRSLQRTAFIARALSATRRLNPTHVYTNHIHLGPLAVAAAELSGGALLTHLHGVEIWGPVSELRRRALERSARVIAVSRDTRSRALALTTLSPERVVVVNNTMSDSFIPGDKAAARHQIVEECDAPLLLTVGRLASAERYKGHERVIEALAKLGNRARGARYLIAGDGDDRAHLANLAAKFDLERRVRFLGHVENNLLPTLYRAADLYVMPSTGEGFGIAFVEAMACGTPALGLAAGGARDALADGTLGIITTPNAFEMSLAKALEALPLNQDALASKTRAHFGRKQFDAAIHASFTAAARLGQFRQARL